MADEPDPPRKFYQLKPKEFERVNAPRPGDESAAPPASPTSSKSPESSKSPTPSPSGPIDVRQLAKLASANTRLLSGNAPANRANDVHAMLAGNHARADAAGLNDIAFQPRRRSKRKRDYWIVLIAGNGLIVGAYATQIVIGFQVQCIAARMPFEFFNLIRWAVSTPAMYAIPSLGILFFSAGLTWLMFHVMNDY
jgi:hypothetical protein